MIIQFEAEHIYEYINRRTKIPTSKLFLDGEL